MTFNLADLWERVAAVIPEAPAIVDGNRRFSYAELDHRATQLAQHLAAQGIGAGDHVALYLHNCSEYLEGMLAAFKIRAVPVNVNYRYVANELLYLFCDSHTTAIIYHPEFESRIAAIQPEVPTLRHTLAVGPDYEAALAQYAPTTTFATRSADDHYVLYTGGTTGLPKGVVWRHEDLFFAALGGGANGREPITDPEVIVDRCVDSRVRCVAACPFMHGSAHWMALSTLLTGGCVIAAPTRHFDANELLDLIASEHANFVIIVGDAYARPLADALADRDPDDFESLRVIVSGGAILSPAIKTELIARLPEVIVVDGYGASETGGQGQAVTASGSPNAATAFRLDATTTILDEHTLLPVGDGIVGLLARSGNIPIGYFNDAKKTAATFKTIDGVRFAIPGDHAFRQDDGTITLLGRGTACINTGGEKVYPDEVESRLKTHPSIFDAVVVGAADDRFGERVVALVQQRPDQVLDARELRAYLQAHLAGYKIPRAIVVVDEVVRSPSGKPDIRWARDRARSASE